MIPFLLAQAAISSNSVNYSYSVNGNGNPAATLAFAAVILVVEIGIAVLLCWLLSSDLEAVPPQYRQNLTPGQVWLLLIPLFNLIWNFFVFPRMADSFRAYFESTGRPQPGDYGRGMGLALSIVVCCCVIPCVNLLAAPAALVLFILLLVKFNGYKKMIQQGGGGGFPVEPMPPQ